MSDLRTDIERVLSQIQSAEQTQSASAPKIEQPVPSAAVRAFVTKWALWAYLGYAVVVGLYIMARGESAQSTQLIDIMKTLLLPIVTLVLGFYFGSKAD